MNVTNVNHATAIKKRVRDRGDQLNMIRVLERLRDTGSIWEN